MANDFRFGVVALDRFSSIFGKLRRAAASSVRPLANVEKVSAKIFSFPRVDDAGKSFAGLARHTREIANNLGGISGSAASIFGIGASGSLVAAAAAVTSLTGKWAALTFQVNQSSQLIGVSTDFLQRWRGAAALANVSADVMTQAIGQLAAKLQDARFGRNPELLMMLGKLGIAFDQTLPAAQQLPIVLSGIATAISRVSDPQTQRVIASAFGLEEALPLLRQGPDAIRRLADETQRLANVQGKDALEWADKFTASLNRLKGAIEGVMNRIGSKMAPAMVWLMDDITGFISGDAKSPSRSALNALTGQRQAAPPVAAASQSSPSQPGTAFPGFDALRPKRLRWESDEQYQRDVDALGVLRRELAAARDPGDRAALQREIALRTGEPLSVIIQITGAPPGTQAQAMVGGRPVSPRISHAMPSGNLP